MNNGIDYFPLVSLIIFYTLLMGRTALLFSQGVNPFVIGKGKTRLSLAREILLIPGLVLWSLEVVLHALKAKFHVFPAFINTPIIHSAGLRYVSYPVTVLGMALFVWALISFRGSWRMGIDKDHPGSLITNGAFAISRNPIFLFLDIYFLAIFLYYQNLLFLVFSIAVIVSTHSQILEEEQFLIRNYGQPYRDYMKRVKRYLFF